MQNSGKGTDEATAISARDTNSATASPPPDDDKKEDAEKKIDSKSEKHIFRQKEGHLADTPENQKLIERVANDPKTKLGVDKYGSTWNATINSNGQQVWTQSNGGRITNAGINSTPRTLAQKPDWLN